MCMLLTYYDETSENGEYRLILVNIRDEYWDRSTANATFWGDDKQYLSGIDLKGGGGMWFGVSKSGKLGSLLNVLEPYPDPTFCTRGFLVSDFLRSPHSPHDYLNTVCKDAKKFNRFNLVLMQFSPSLKLSLSAVSNWKESEWYMRPTDIDPSGIQVFSNCRLSRPWKKIEHARGLFKTIIDDYKVIRQRDRLVGDIFNMLQDQTLNLPDPELQRQGRKLSDDMCHNLSAVYVFAPSSRFGSRTHTVFLVDSLGKGEYIERTMDDHGVEDMDGIKWTTSKYHFTINPPPTDSKTRIVNHESDLMNNSS